MSTSDIQNQKSHIAVGKASGSSGKGKWRTYSAHFCWSAGWWDEDSAYCDVLV